ncbi:hypothetical protein NLI92_002884 [Priestia megaterium]|uniref:hypothetical protein n=1 Tax=Priestia megaterium TaxID=1404 RepID=UPI0021ACFAFD|nr:hypothetical protein [Priestia megaterium]MCR8927495.1 hypothetical protein [Priestia megaterium]
MKKILAFILIISIVGVLVSCGKEKATTEPKPKTCEQIEPCKTALQYATYVEQGAADKVYDMEAENPDLKSYGSLEEAKDGIADDYKEYEQKKIDKYQVLEYELFPKKDYVYKFRFFDFRSKEKKNLTIRLEKEGNEYLATRYFGGASKRDVTVNGRIATHRKYYSAGLTQQEKDVLSPDPIEK